MKLRGKEKRANVRTATNKRAIALYLPDFLIYKLTPLMPTYAATNVTTANKAA